MSSEHVLSIQSSVVSGYVGNKCAVFCLNNLGFQVDAINTGTRMNGKEFNDLIHGLRLNHLLGYSHVLSGYVGDVTLLHALRATVLEIQSLHADVVYVCDPVLGDSGKLYVPEEFVAIYREIVPLATIITPNQTEMELLTGRVIESEVDAIQSCWQVHTWGVPIVIITSLTLPHDASLVMLVSVARDDKQTCYRYDIPRLPRNFTGTGDCMTALLLAYCNPSLGAADVESGCELALAVMQAILASSIQSETQELQLIQSRHIFQNVESLPKIKSVCIRSPSIDSL